MPLSFFRYVADREQFRDNGREIDSRPKIQLKIDQFVNVWFVFGSFFISHKSHRKGSALSARNAQAYWFICPFSGTWPIVSSAVTTMQRCIASSANLFTPTTRSVSRPWHVSMDASKRASDAGLYSYIYLYIYIWCVWVYIYNLWRTRLRGLLGLPIGHGTHWWTLWKGSRMQVYMYMYIIYG